VIVACLVTALFLQGVDEHVKLIPRIRVPVGLQEQTSPEYTWRLYYFGVQNTGGTTVTNASVRLSRISPAVADLSWLPVALHIKHDNEPLYKTEMNLNPGEMKHIDLAQKSNADTDITLCLARKVNYVLPAGRYKLEVEVTGQNVPPIMAYFEVWVDCHGVLRCVAL
jgi:hypothetical protein